MEFEFWNLEFHTRRPAHPQPHRGKSEDWRGPRPRGISQHIGMFAESSKMRSSYGLRIRLAAGKVAVCRFTSFIAISAEMTARYWCGPRIGRGPSAPSAGRTNYPRSSPSLHRQPQVRDRRLLRVRGIRGHAECAARADRIRTKPTIQYIVSSIQTASASTNVPSLADSAQPA